MEGNLPISRGSESMGSRPSPLCYGGFNSGHRPPHLGLYDSGFLWYISPFVNKILFKQIKDRLLINNQTAITFLD